MGDLRAPSGIAELRGAARLAQVVNRLSTKTDLFTLRERAVLLWTQCTIMYTVCSFLYSIRDRRRGLGGA